MTLPSPHPDESESRLTFSVRRSHVHGAVGLAAGLLLGLAAGRWSAPRPPAAAAPAAAAVAPAAIPTHAGSLAPDAATRARALDLSGRAVRGAATAPVTIVEFTDYECPFCRTHFDSTLEPLLARYGDRVRYAVKNYPIGSLHPRAFQAAEAAECAAEQGRFWPYHDRLFRSRVLDRARLDTLARQTGLDAARFARCVDSRAMSLRVQRDVADGNALGVGGTPSFFINGSKVEGAVPLEAFAQMLDAALAGQRTGGATP